MMKALKKEIVFPYESVTNTEEDRMLAAKAMRFKNFGYLFGMEDPLVNCFTSLVSTDYQIVYFMSDSQEFLKDFSEDEQPGILERYNKYKARILETFACNAFTKKAWKEFISKDASMSFKNKASSEIQIINMLINQSTKNSAIVLCQQIEQIVSLTPDAFDWKRLVEDFANYVLDKHVAKLPVEKRPNIEIIKRYLSEPRDTEDVLYIRFDFNVHWRDSFIKENLMIAIECAQKFNKALKIVIGQDHYDDIKAFLESKGLPVTYRPCKTDNLAEAELRELLTATKSESERVKLFQILFLIICIGLLSWFLYPNSNEA